MIRAFFSILVLLFATLVYAQDSTIALSRYELYCTTPGRVLKTTVVTIGRVRSATVQVLKTSIMQSGDSLSVVRITTEQDVPLITNYNLYIEKNELDTLMNLIQMFDKEIKNRDVLRQFNYAYITINNVQITSTYDQDYNTTPGLLIRKVFPYLRTAVPNSNYWFGRRDLQALLDILQLAKKQL